MKVEVNSSSKQVQALTKKTVEQFFKNIKINPKAVISYHFISVKKMRTLNKKYRQIDQPTDVLSFPVWEDLRAIPKEGAVTLGDIFICSAFAQDEKELENLIRHGLNHLIGKHH